MLRRNTDGLVTYHFESFAAEDLVHAVFTRLGGASQEPFATLNAGRTVGDDEAAVTENHARIYAHLAVGGERIVTPSQVHSNRVGVVTANDAGQVIPNTDGLVTDAPELGLLLRFADCQPILLYDPVNHALGLIHAGWRGVAQAIARRAVETMHEAFGSRPRDLNAGLGPAIGPCCYVVGHNVASAMGYALPDWDQAMKLEDDKWRLDLTAANTQQLAAAGVRKIEQAHLCTACHHEEFFSHRADNGRTGRFAVMAYLKARTVETNDGRTEKPRGDPELSESVELASLHPPGLPAFQDSPGGNS